MTNELSPIAKKIKEAMEEWTNRLEGGRPKTDHVDLDEREPLMRSIAERKAELLYISDEEIKRRLPIGHGGPTVTTHQSIGIRWLRDRLFKPKEEDQ